jgi:hypothetical protein
MKLLLKMAIGVAASLGLGAAAVLAQPGPMDGGMGAHQGGVQHGGMGMHGQGGTGHGPMGAGAATRSGMGPGMMHGMGSMGGHAPMAGAVSMLTRQDAGSSADMGLVHELLVNHQKIRRTVTKLPDGIRTVTESDDPQVAQAIKAHVASMSQRLDDGREFNIFSTTLPVLFENKDKIRSTVTMTERGSVVTRTSADAKVVAALQGHAAEVTELAQEGMVAMRRGMMTRMAMQPRGAQAGARP